MNSEIFIKCLGMLQGAFGAIDENRVKALKFALEDFTDNDLMFATKNILKTFKPTGANPFPVPAQFFSAIGADSEAKAEKAIAMINEATGRFGAYYSLDFGYPEIHSVINRFGGWVLMCAWTKEDWSINEGRLKVALKTAFEFGVGETINHVAGIFERTNCMIRDRDIVCLLRRRPLIEYQADTGKIKRDQDFSRISQS